MSIVSTVLSSPGILGSMLPVVEVIGRQLSASELQDIGDPGRTRTVYAAIAFLIAIGVGLLVLAGWLIRSTRVDPEVLAPLELMGQRSWRSGDPVWQRRRLDEVRPAGAEPLVRMASPPDADPDFERGPPLGDFSDFDDLLRDLGVEIETADPDGLPVADLPEVGGGEPESVVEVGVPEHEPLDASEDSSPGEPVSPVEGMADAEEPGGGDGSDAAGSHAGREGEGRDAVPTPRDDR